jgi:hypothetical protein
MEMNDQRMILRPAFDSEDRLDRLFVRRVSSEAIDRFRGKRDETSLSKDSDCLAYQREIRHGGIIGALENSDKALR